MMRLSPRQTQIARLVAQARSDKQIAQLLGLETQTVKNHLSRIYQRRGAANRVELALQVVRGEIAEAGNA